jgi:putative glutamine amidotransferase
MKRAKIGLTDTYYTQIRVILENMGGAAVELVTPTTLKEYFSLPSFLGFGSGPLEIRNTRFEIKKGCEVDYYIAEFYEKPQPLDQFIIDYRAKGGSIMDGDFMGALINLEAVERHMASLDGLLVAGGEDINPYFYAASDKGTQQQHRTRDIIELAYIREALRQDKPVFAICRGAQVLAVALGGQLIQDIPSHDPQVGTKHGLANEAEKAAGHDVCILKSSRLAKYMELEPQQDAGPENFIRVNVNSYHHQAIAGAFDGVELAAWDYDPLTHGVSPVIEAFIVPARDFVVGVQWHPERPLLVKDAVAAMTTVDFDTLVAHWRRHDEALFRSFLTAAHAQK